MGSAASVRLAREEAQLARRARRSSPDRDHCREARPIVVLVDDEDATATFLAARAPRTSSALRPSPERARDVYVFVGHATDFFDGQPTRRRDPEYDALSRLTFADIPDEGTPTVWSSCSRRSTGNRRSDHPHPRAHRRDLGIRGRDDPLPIAERDQPGRLSWRPSPPGRSRSRRCDPRTAHAARPRLRARRVRRTRDRRSPRHRPSAPPRSPSAR